MFSAKVPATQTATSTPDIIRPLSELRVDRAKLKAGLPAGLRENFRLPISFERNITRDVRKAVAQCLLKGLAPTLANCLEPKHGIQIPVRYFDKSKGRKGQWVETLAPASERIRRRQEELYGEYAGKGITRSFLPLLNEKITPAKATLVEAVQNSHTAVPGAKALPKLEIIWIGGDDEAQPQK